MKSYRADTKLENDFIRSELFIFPVVALGFGIISSCLNVSYKRPRCKTNRPRQKVIGRRVKKHNEIIISWKGKVSMGMMATLLLAGVGVHGHDTFNNGVTKETNPER